jgi:hypothetical protein
MNYLKQIYNSFIIITNNFLTKFYCYVDPLYLIKKQIINKDYDLNTIMYKRMEKLILKSIPKKIVFDYLIHIPYTNSCINVNDCRVDNKHFKEIIMLAVKQYREQQLWNINRQTYICGLNPLFTYCYKSVMINDLNNIDKLNENYNTYSKQEIYKLWVKL